MGLTGLMGRASEKAKTPIVCKLPSAIPLARRQRTHAHQKKALAVNLQRCHPINCERSPWFEELFLSPTSMNILACSVSCGPSQERTTGETERDHTRSFLRVGVSDLTGGRRRTGRPPHDSRSYDDDHCSDFGGSTSSPTTHDGEWQQRHVGGV